MKMNESEIWDVCGMWDVGSRDVGCGKFVGSLWEVRLRWQGSLDVSW